MANTKTEEKILKILNLDNKGAAKEYHNIFPHESMIGKDENDFRLALIRDIVERNIRLHATQDKMGEKYADKVKLIENTLKKNDAARPAFQHVYFADNGDAVCTNTYWLFVTKQESLEGINSGMIIRPGNSKYSFIDYKRVLPAECDLVQKIVVNYGDVKAAIKLAKGSKSGISRFTLPDGKKMGFDNKFLLLGLKLLGRDEMELRVKATKKDDYCNTSPAVASYGDDTFVICPVRIQEEATEIPAI